MEIKEGPIIDVVRCSNEWESENMLEVPYHDPKGLAAPIRIDRKIDKLIDTTLIRKDYLDRK